ncbi:hypothetical protein K435DRAFT_716600 [Dendrothele bispora CBS 962.96]|uniref:MYND-type domain-containing protein n=1 Tax=Dendrothele bispora (strain CBS 962.96) TaxID=1314807 RepID=A0A4V4HHG9_DENBC|nr:hypothetical protein K435DRAFT_716600 [Dendrothele bispora CBS 962.96]
MQSQVSMGSRMPPLTAATYQSCAACFKDDTQSPLSRCSKCQSIVYCSAACQKTDWGKHKSLCKAIASLVGDPLYRASLLFTLDDSPSIDLQSTNELCETNTRIEMGMIEKVLKRPLSVKERNMFGWQPRCIGCSRTDRVIRLENSPLYSTLKSCPDCRLAFYCSEDHWNAVKHLHAQPSSADNDVGLSQCEMNQQFRMDVRFQYSVPEAGPFQWAPERTKKRWERLGPQRGVEIKKEEQGKETCWEEEFSRDLEEAMQGARIPVVMPFLRAASKGLSMPMTILYALQNLNGSDESWTKKDTLVIHILGASFATEVRSAQLFEEILHRLPEVKTLRLLLVGPEINAPDSKPVDMETCPDCRRKGRKRIHQHHNMLYHDFVSRQSARFENPDLAIAFNSGASARGGNGTEPGPGDSWKETMKLLVERKIPGVFTSFNKSEALIESQMLREAGATLFAQDQLGPCRNPWGTMSLIPEPNGVTGWYGESMWLAGGFKG